MLLNCSPKLNILTTVKSRWKLKQTKRGFWSRSTGPPFLKMGSQTLRFRPPVEACRCSAGGWFGFTTFAMNLDYVFFLGGGDFDGMSLFLLWMYIYIYKYNFISLADRNKGKSQNWSYSNYRLQAHLPTKMWKILIHDVALWTALLQWQESTTYATTIALRCSGEALSAPRLKRKSRHLCQLKIILYIYSVSLNVTKRCLMIWFIMCFLTSCVYTICFCVIVFMLSR